MPRVSTQAANASLNGLDGTGTTNTMPYIGAHVGDPGTTGANENANTGSYARQAVTMNAAASSAKTNSTGLTFSTAGTVPVTYLDGWSSATYAAGNPSVGAPLGASVTSTTILVASGAASWGSA